MEQKDEPAIRAFDENGEEVDLSTIDTREVDSDEDINDGGAVDEHGVVVGEPEEGTGAVGTLPDQVTVTLPRPLLVRAFEKAGRELPGTMGTAEIVDVLELVLN